ncbi:hypothetical protein OUZ56_013877 [Daphnia magna]|uniref:Uncharacterized protein n=1 Tax=Daphnia magna TaxID=35525 RepID=A0ABQ9Z769_9CRUS|nr:hypothetical protein OUZ56_013877 [Daphnia magna]
MNRRTNTMQKTKTKSEDFNKNERKIKIRKKERKAAGAGLEFKKNKRVQRASNQSISVDTTIGRHQTHRSSRGQSEPTLEKQLRLLSYFYHSPFLLNGAALP